MTVRVGPNGIRPDRLGLPPSGGPRRAAGKDDTEFDAVTDMDAIPGGRQGLDFPRLTLRPAPREELVRLDRAVLGLSGHPVTAGCRSRGN